MLKLTKTGIGLLTKQYRSVLRKCLLLNLGLFFVSSQSFAIWVGTSSSGHAQNLFYCEDERCFYDNSYYAYNIFWLTSYSLDDIQNIQSLNYYYTFRVDERAEAAEFALFLGKEKLSNVFEA